MKFLIVFLLFLTLSGCMHTVSYDTIGGAHWRTSFTWDGK